MLCAQCFSRHPAHPNQITAATKPIQRNQPQPPPPQPQPPQPFPRCRDNWNVFDFFIVLVSITGVILDYATTQSLTVLPLLRVFRVARIFKLIPKARGLRTLISTLLWCAHFEF